MMLSALIRVFRWKNSHQHVMLCIYVHPHLFIKNKLKKKYFLRQGGVTGLAINS